VGADVKIAVGDEPGSRAPRNAVLDWLVAHDLADPAATQRAARVSGKTGQPIEQVLNQLGALSDEDLVAAYCAVTGCDRWNPKAHPAEAELAARDVSVTFLRQRRILPLAERDGSLLCAVCDPLDEEGLSGLVFATGKPVIALVAGPGEWRRAFEGRYPDSTPPEAEADERRLAREIDQVADATVEGGAARLVAAAFEEAIRLGASDIHFEPVRHQFKVRLRVDGRLVDHAAVTADLAAPAVSRIKVLAKLDLGERRLPQDGRTTFVVEGRSIDVRVSVVPTVFGEAAVLRILDRANVKLDLGALGWTGAPAAAVARAATAPHGLFLVSGPTGSGKTTTLYTLLESFRGSHKKILSVEDPVEFHFEHVAQTQTAPAIGLTFATALRSFLRQDPDVIMVGEIRDAETATVAVQAAMTGHLVLASVHANDALRVARRLQDMGVEPYQLAACLLGAAAQRLVRRLCPECRVERPATESEARFAMELGTQLSSTFDARGCPSCNDTGFRGRVAVTEAFIADEDFLKAVADGGRSAGLRQAAIACGLVPMAIEGLAKARAGLTTVEEVMAAVSA